MNTTIRRLAASVIFAACLPAFAADPLKETLQKGLFEEEANRNFEAAAQAYRKVISSYDKDRQTAATAIFRLAECYRKLGQTNEANAQYERIVREFSDQKELADLSRTQVADRLQAKSNPGNVQTNATIIIDPEGQELARWQRIAKESPDLINAPTSDDPAGHGDSKPPLHWAVSRGQGRVVEFLLTAGADVNQTTYYGDSPLHLAAQLGHKAIAEKLLAHGAGVNQFSTKNQGRTPLYYAAREGFKEVTELLLAHGADPAMGDLNGTTPLHSAAVHGSESIVALLLEHKASIESRSKANFTPLAFAAREGHIEALQLLLAKGADVNARLNTQFTNATPLLLALGYGLWNSSRDIIRIDSRERDAALFRFQPVISALVEGRADVNAASSTGFTPLMAAARAGDLPAVKLLVGKGAIIDAKDDSQMSPLHYAMINTNIPIVEFLVSNKADVNISGPTGWTILHSAAARGLNDVVRLLVDHGARLDVQDDAGFTPLHYAAFFGLKDTVALLLANHARTDIKNENGATAYALVVASPRPTYRHDFDLGIPHFEPLSAGGSRLGSRVGGFGSFSKPPAQKDIEAITEMLKRVQKERETLQAPRGPLLPNK